VERLTNGALTRRIEPADLVDSIIVENDSQSLFVPVMDIDDPTPNGKLTGFFYQVDPPISRRGEAIRQPPLVENFTRRHPLDVGRHRLGQRQGSEQCPNRDDHHLDLTVGNSPKEANQLEARGERGLGALIGGAEITRNSSHAEPRREKLQAGGEIVDIGHMGNHHGCDCRFPTAVDEGGHRQRSSAGNHPAHGQRCVTTIEGLDQRGKIGQRIL
jgi:hypothetical protein